MATSMLTSTTQSHTRPTKNVNHGQYVMPAEHRAHSHTLMAFPSITSTDDDEQLLKALQSEVTSIANTISEFEPVHLYAREESVQKAKSMVGPNVRVKSATVDQLWIRDSGPVYVQDISKKTRTPISFGFNYWGNKLDPTGDQYLAKQVAEQENETLVTSRLVLEGGSIEHDGEGTFLGTESCIINNNRNPGLSKKDVEAELRNTLGVTHFIWIQGIEGYDITDYHIDALARFVEPGVVILSKPVPYASEIVIKAYEEARAALLQSKDARGRSLVVHDCDEPDASMFGPPDAHNEVVATYVNYLLINGAVIMPKFGQDTYDQRAFELFKKLFPSRQIVQVLLNMLPRTGGGIHCATQQVPQM